MDLAADLLAFFEEYRRCGELDGHIEQPIVWMACSCGAYLLSGWF